MLPLCYADPLDLGTLSLSYLGSGCSTAVEHVTSNQGVMGSIVGLFFVLPIEKTKTFLCKVSL